MCVLNLVSYTLHFFLDFLASQTLLDKLFLIILCEFPVSILTTVCHPSDKQLITNYYLYNISLYIYGAKVELHIASS